MLGKFSDAEDALRDYICSAREAGFGDFDILMAFGDLIVNATNKKFSATEKGGGSLIVGIEQ